MKSAEILVTYAVAKYYVQYYSFELKTNIKKNKFSKKNLNIKNAVLYLYNITAKVILFVCLSVYEKRSLLCYI